MCSCMAFEQFAVMLHGNSYFLHLAMWSCCCFDAAAAATAVADANAVDSFVWVRARAHSPRFCTMRTFSTDFFHSSVLICDACMRVCIGSVIGILILSLLLLYVVSCILYFIVSIFWHASCFHCAKQLN